MSSVENKVVSETESIAKLCDQNIRLVIPSYQRPYVWPAADLSKLLEDIKNAMEAKEPHYYIGTLLSTKLTDGRYELIDGQQRMTTLMLLALAFKGHLRDEHHPLLAFAKHGNEPRLSFSIRDSAKQFLVQAAGPDDALDAKVNCAYVAHLATGLKAARDKLNELSSSKIDLDKLARYLCSNVHWVNNFVPRNTDLNRLFTRINTSGVQLEQSDILKAKLLARIPDQASKQECDAIWQACENMSHYFERNVRKLFPQADWATLQYEDLAAFDRKKFMPERQVPGEKQQDESAALSLKELWEELSAQPDRSVAHRVERQSKQESNANNDDDLSCRSIIGFPLLLIHAYRLYCVENGIPDIKSRVHPQKLAAGFERLFKEDGEDNEQAKIQAIEFIQCLWRVRYQFDRCVVKWVQRDGEEHLVLASTAFGADKRIVRNYPESVSDLVQLQAVRYFTGERSAQYWLTAFLGRMLKVSGTRNEEVLKVLEQIDNDLSLAECTQKEASFVLARNEALTGKDFAEIGSRLIADRWSTGFEHYWFQKLEYVLWKRRKQDELDEGRLQRFRISSKNSVEHVHPQNHAYSNQQLPSKEIDGFGNLALLSPGENARYSNLDPAQKKVDFNRKHTYDSLKLAHLFRLMGMGDWTPKLMDEHCQNMVNFLAAHYCPACLQR